VLCPVCSSDQWHPVFTAHDLIHETSTRSFPVVECAGCGLGRTDFGRDPPDLASIYPADYIYHEGTGSRSRSFSRRASERAARAIGSLGYWRWCDPKYADFEERGATPGLVLDVGCGAGRYLRRLADLGWKVRGIEPSSAAAAAARRDGFAVETATAEGAVYPVATLDLITMYHSLEHCDRPQLVIEHSVRALKHGGVIAIALCNFDSPGRRFFGAAWPLLEIPRHRYHFTPASLSRLVERSGARVEAVYYHNDLGDVPTALGDLAWLRRHDGHVGRSGTSGGRATLPRGPFRAGPTGVGKLLTLSYAPILRAVGLSMRSSFLLRCRRN